MGSVETVFLETLKEQKESEEKDEHSEGEEESRFEETSGSEMVIQKKKRGENGSEEYSEASDSPDSEKEKSKVK